MPEMSGSSMSVHFPDATGFWGMLAHHFDRFIYLLTAFALLLALVGILVKWGRVLVAPNLDEANAIVSRAFKTLTNPKMTKDYGGRRSIGCRNPDLIIVAIRGDLDVVCVACHRALNEMLSRREFRNACIFITVVACGVVWLVSSKANAHHTGFTDQYDEVLEDAWRRHAPPGYSRVNWTVLKAVCVVESSLREGVVSAAGAEGLCQVLPSTAAWLRSIRGDLPSGSLRMAKVNAQISSAYVGRLWKFWIWDRTILCRLDLVLASYNAGPGSVAKAQTLSGGEICWPGINPYLERCDGEAC